jgi:hypothetical protein
MIVFDPDIVRASVGPAESDPPLVVDAQTICPFAIPLQLLEPIPSWLAKLGGSRHTIELPQLAPGSLLDVGRQLATVLAVPNTLGLSVGEE